MVSSRFVIVTTQRTGATFFRTCLESHPDVRCPGTLFAQKTRLKYFSVDRRDSYYRKFRSRSLSRQIAHWINRERLVHSCLGEAYGTSSDSLALGFKMSYSNLERYPSVVPWLLGHDIKVIHWIRRNLIKQYVSKLTKNARRQAHSTKPMEKVSVYVNPRELRKNLEEQSRLIEKYRAIFRGQEYIELYYETFTTNQEVEARKILQFLGVNERVPLTSSLVKQNPDDLEEIISNYREVVDELKGTNFGQLLATES